MRNMKVSKYRGVTRGNRGWFKAQLRIGETIHRLGEFHSEEDAALAYDNCIHALMVQGRRREARFNFPNDSDSGDKSKPEYSQATSRVVESFIAANSSQPATSTRFTFANDSSLRGNIHKLYIESRNRYIADIESLIRLSELSTTMGVHELGLETNERLAFERLLRNHLEQCKPSHG